MAMAGFRKRTVLSVVIFISIFLVSCEASENYVKSVLLDDQIVFTGVPVHRDNLHWPEGRDSDWEMDIRYFAVNVLRNHPLLIDYNHMHSDGIARETYSYYVYEMLMRRAAARNGILTNDIDVMRDGLRDIFIDKVNALIMDIPSRNDAEVKFGLSEAAAIFGDSHTRIHWENENVFPVQIIALYDGIYFAGVPSEIEHALYAELLAVNGIDIWEIVERIGKVHAHENEYGLRDITQFFLMSKELLRYIDVADDSGLANFTVRLLSGEIADIELQTIGKETFDSMIQGELFVRHEFSSLLMHRYPEKSFWHEYFYEDSLMYMRIRSFGERGVVDNLQAELRAWPQGELIEKLVVDLRGNAGGRSGWFMDHDLLGSDRVRAVYIIIDSGSASASVVAAATIRESGANVKTVGEPTGQMENFFSAQRGNLPNSGLWYFVSMAIVVQSNSYDEAFRPDIFIPLTIGDIVERNDPVLDYIWP